MDVRVRPAHPEDPAPALLYESARPYYDRYAGDAAHALALLDAVYPRSDHAASFELCRVAEVDGAVVGVVAGFPATESDHLARRFIALTLPRLPLWRWPGLLRHLRASGRVAPRPPTGAWYVDALAVAESARRRGVARALLADAERSAQAAGSTGVALDTGIGNAAARALYEGYGFRQRDLRRAPDAKTAEAIGGEGFVSYFKRL
jgi:ribosomal protein S18 acetylase RimI-like enzyme